MTRNSDLFVDEEEVDDLLRALEGELPTRRFGDEVRLEITHDAPADISASLMAEVRSHRERHLSVSRPGEPENRSSALPDFVDRPDLKFPGFIRGCRSA